MQEESTPASEPMRRARRALEAAVQKGPEADASSSVELARALLDLARELEKPAERRRRIRMARLVSDPDAQRFAVALTDRASRRATPARLGAIVAGLEEHLGIPEALEPWQRLGLRWLPAVSRWMPELAAVATEAAVQREASAYVVRGEASLERLLRRSQRAGFSVNLNQLGEEVVGEEQARRHLEHYLERIARSDVRALSVKISALFSQTSVVAFEESLDVLAERLRLIYRAALTADPVKLVYLDMESYRDAELTLTLFRRLLNEPEFGGLTAGVVLQAYLPESVAWQRELVAFARQRRRRGGAPVRLRLVKGANLAMERVESSLRGWPVPILPSKAEVDAQFKHMLREGVAAAGEDVLRLGVGSHNLFDIAYALVLRARSPHPDNVELEMLHGMAEPLRRAVRRLGGPVLVYVPAVSAQDFPSAVAYLVRRFDENASEENFLRHGFEMASGDARFESQRELFERSFAAFQERATARPPMRSASLGPSPGLASAFRNEADTDPSRPEDREFLRRCLVPEAPLERVPVSVGDRERFEGPMEAGFDPSRPGCVPYRYRVATEAEIDEALETAERFAESWGSLEAEERIRVIRAAAEELRRARGELIRALVLDGGKRVEEADAEVSEAVDFAMYYAATYEELSREWETTPRGVVLVTPPWNFPLAIPLGGVLAALVAGNAVLLKPAPETPLIAYLGAAALWRAGVPREALQFVPCHEVSGSRLVRDARVDTVILTGATETARLFRRLRPGIRLLAETGGKNALIVSAASDRELAIRDAVRSAFGHAGQKCSALSLLIVERELYESADFCRQLRDAAESLPVGSAWDARSFVTPLIREPGPDLSRGLTLEGGEEWLLEPRRSRENPRLVSPGIKIGVTSTSHSYCTELFGPVLSVLPADDLQQALELANGTPYGLTAGFHGLDEREQAYFIEHMRAGNLYVNRPITGAIVGRQPFGGQKASSFGPGAKAGGPNYVQQLCRLLRRKGAVATLSSSAPGIVAPVLRTGGWVRSERSSGRASGAGQLLAALRASLASAEQEHLERRLDEYRRALGELMSPQRLQPQLLGEANWFRYQSCRVAVVLGAVDAVDVATVLGLQELLGERLELWVLGARPGAWLDPLLAAEAARAARDMADLVARWGHDVPARVRLLGVDEAEAWRALGGTDAHVEAEPLAEIGRVELLRYFVEQSVSIGVHRYGNLGMAAFAPVPRGSGAPRTEIFKKIAR